MNEADHNHSMPCRALLTGTGAAAVLESVEALAEGSAGRSGVLPRLVSA